MSLEQMSFLAQIVSALVVVASLIFVGFQLNHAAAAIRVASSQAHLECYTDLAKSVIDDGDFARIWRVGLGEPKKLTEDEWVRFVACCERLAHRLATTAGLRGRRRCRWRCQQH